MNIVGKFCIYIIQLEKIMISEELMIIMIINHMTQNQALIYITLMVKRVKLNKGIFALNVHIKALFGILSIKKKKKAKRNLILVEKKEI